MARDILPILRRAARQGAPVVQTPDLAQDLRRINSTIHAARGVRDPGRIDTATLARENGALEAIGRVVRATVERSHATTTTGLRLSVQGAISSIERDGQRVERIARDDEARADRWVRSGGTARVGRGGRWIEDATAAPIAMHRVKGSSAAACVSGAAPAYGSLAERRAFAEGATDIAAWARGASDSASGDERERGSAYVADALHMAEHAVSRDDYAAVAAFVRDVWRGLNDGQRAGIVNGCLRRAVNRRAMFRAFRDVGVDARDVE